MNLEEARKKREENLEISGATLKWIGVLYIYLVIVLAGYAIFYWIKSDEIKETTIANSLLLNPVAEKADLERSEGVRVPPIDIQKVASLPYPENSIQKGKALYVTNCASCHGNEGRGDGIAAAALPYKPRNFYSTTGWTKGRTFVDVFNTLYHGISERGMAGYGYLPLTDRIALTHYVLSLGPAPKSNTTTELSAIDKEHSLSKGKMAAAQITVKTATELLLDENKGALAKIDRLIRELERATNQPGATLMADYTYDHRRLFTALGNTRSWANSPRAFSEFMTSAPYEKGLKSSIVGLNEAQWSQLFDFTKRMMNL